MFGRKKDKGKDKVAETAKANANTTPVAPTPTLPQAQKCTSVKGVGYSCDQNARHRGTMEVCQMQN